jgi:hypothetical protein
VWKNKAGVVTAGNALAENSLVPVKAHWPGRSQIYLQHRLKDTQLIRNKRHNQNFLPRSSKLLRQGFVNQWSPDLASTFPSTWDRNIFAQGAPNQCARVGFARLLIHPAIGVSIKPYSLTRAEGSQATNQTDVRTFRCFNRADTAIMRVMNVTDIETGAFTAQTARAKGRERALVAQFGQRIGLIHELRELAGAKEFAQGGHHRADVDQRNRGKLLLVTDGHAFFDNALHAAQADAQFILNQFANRLDAAIAEVVNIIRGSTSLLI